VRATNRSQVPAAELATILKFLGPEFPKAKDTAVVLETQDPGLTNIAFMTGDAHPSGGWALGLNQRHLVTVYVPTLERPYPTSQRNPAGGGDACPWADLRSWDDELVLVLAHELRHVEQFTEAAPVDVVEDRDDAFEVDAEKRAVDACELWKANKGETK
jgi:hypothetical protein